MGSEVAVSADAFGVAFDSMLDGIGSAVEDALPPAVKKGCHEAKKTTVMTAHGYGWSGRYTSGFGYEVDKSGAVVEGEMGNSQPGLVHLLEKGHALIGGGRSGAFPHMEQGYADGVAAFEDKLLEGVDKALNG